MKALAALVLSIVGCCCVAVAQCPSTDFSVNPTACREQLVSVSNLSAPGASSWDFCSGDFTQTPTAQLLGTLAGVSGFPGVEFAYDTRWHAFVTGTFSNVLYRLDFDAGLQATPTAIVNLGSLTGALNQPGQVRIVNVGGAWFGVLHNTSGELIKLSFGSQLSNVPTTSSLISGLGTTSFGGLAVGKDPVHGYVCVLSNLSNQNQFTIIRLGASLTAPNPMTDVLTSAAVTNPNTLGDVDIINICGSWYGVAVNFGNSNLYRLDFGTSLFSIPTITELPQALPAANPGRLRLAREGERFYFLALSFDDGTLTKGDFGNDITSIPALTNEGNLGGVLPARMYGLGMVKDNSTWAILGVNQANGQYYRIQYNDNCVASPRTSIQNNPTVAYSNAGTFAITLDNTSGTNVGVKSRTISISSSVAPDIDFTTLNNCAMNAVNFTPVNVSGDIMNYAWDFDDGNNSAAPSPSNTYLAAGSYTPRLVVTAMNGCVNTASNDLDIYNIPSANFTVPSVSPFCTNQSYNFTNTSGFDTGSNPTWEWRVNGSLISTQADLQTTFLSPVAQEIRLKALIPGCSNEVIQNLGSVLTGPVVNFSAADNCAGDVVSFSNSTTGADAGYVWDFGDGSPTSTQTNPDYAYGGPGDYVVTLTASTLSGCENFTTHSIKIYSVPQPDFTVGLPPFSCSNSPTLFQNDTPGLTDSNITTWFWEFGDPGNSTAAIRDPSFTYSAGGTYSVSLTATSDAGCEASFSKLVNIGSSPEADFINGPACVNQATLFSDISSGGVQSRTWQIGSSVFSSPNPSYTFTAPGTYNVTLTVTGTGGCNDVIIKPVDVPVLPTLVLDVDNPCTDQQTIFTLTDATPPSFVDPVIGWQWNIAGTATSGNPASGVVSLAGTSPVSVTTTHTSGCVYIKTTLVNFHTSPVANFTALPDRGNAPLTVKFQNNSTGATEHHWLFTGPSTGLSSVESPVYTFLELGDYTATLVAGSTNGCSDTLSVPIRVLVPEIDLELTGFTLSPDGQTGKLKPTVTLRNNSNIPVTMAEIAFHLSDRATVTELLTVNLEVGASVTATLTLTLDPAQFAASFVCAEVLSEQDIDIADNRQCITYDEADHIFDPYPNPSQGTLMIDWVGEKLGTATIIVYNSQGRREYSWETASAAGLNQSVHDLSFLAAGIYFVTVQTSTTLQTRRFVRQ